MYLSLISGEKITLHLLKSGYIQAVLLQIIIFSHFEKYFTPALSSSRRPWIKQTINFTSNGSSPKIEFKLRKHFKRACYSHKNYLTVWIRWIMENITNIISYLERKMPASVCIKVIFNHDTLLFLRNYTRCSWKKNFSTV